MSFLVTIGRDEATPEVARVHGLLGSPDRQKAMMNVLGVRAEQELRTWFRRRDEANPNKKGWPRQHFWNRIAKRTAFDPSKTTSASATIAVADPALSAKIDGATIKPTEGRKALSIPLQADAYGVQPRSGIIPGLFVFRVPEMEAAYLVAEENKRLVFYYRLVPQAVVPKDPQALPPQADLGRALGETAIAFYRREQTRGGLN